MFLQKPSKVLGQLICTFNLTLCGLNHNPSVVFFLCRPLIEIHSGPGGACIQNNTILERERATEVKKDIVTVSMSPPNSQDLAKP